MSVAEKQKKSGGLGETVSVIVQALLLALVIRTFLFQPFSIPSGSMRPTLLEGDYLFVTKWAYGYSRFSLPLAPNLFSGRIFGSDPERGDVVVFKFPPNPSLDYIKRVVGLPGDRITYRDKVIYVNDQAVEQRYVGPYTGPSEEHTNLSGARVSDETLGEATHRMMVLPLQPSRGEGSWTVPPDSFFVMGDNRDSSLDSRFWGFVPESNLVGRAMVVWMNFGDFSRIGTSVH